MIHIPAETMDLLATAMSVFCFLIGWLMKSAIAHKVERKAVLVISTAIIDGIKAVDRQIDDKLGQRVGLAGLEAILRLSKDISDKVSILIEAEKKGLQKDVV